MRPSSTGADELQKTSSPFADDQFAAIASMPRFSELADGQSASWHSKVLQKVAGGFRNRRREHPGLPR
jgi:hypothetical protein